MPFTFENLDERTREFMLKELDADAAGPGVYQSPRLTEDGAGQWKGLLEEALRSHNDAWLANELRVRRLFKDQEHRYVRGKTVTAQVPISAAETLSEGEFNRYYARGLCARAVADNIAAVEVYRGKAVDQPRAESQAMLAKRLPAAALLDDLRASAKGVEPALGVPPGPNSGLTVRLPR